MGRSKRSVVVSVRIPLEVKEELKRRGPISDVIREAILAYLRYERLIQLLRKVNGGERP